MRIAKFKHGSLHLQLTYENSFFEAIQGDEFFFENLYYYYSHQDGWQYIYDASTNLVYHLDSYHYNLIDKLLNGKTIILQPHKNDKTYEDYEWNKK